MSHVTPMAGWAEKLGGLRSRRALRGNEAQAGPCKSGLRLPMSPLSVPPLPLDEAMRADAIAKLSAPLP